MKKALKSLALSAAMLMILLPAFSIDSNSFKFSSSKDSMDYVRSLSFYKEFYKIKLYTHAREPWLEVFENYPASSEKLYMDGVKMYRIFLESAEGPQKEGYIDTLMLIYDQRMEYFGGEGNVLGRKGSDLLNYGRTKLDRLRDAYTMLGKSIELEGNKSREQVVMNFISASMMLNKKDVINNSAVVGDYLAVLGILDFNQEKSSRWKRARANIDEIMLKEDILACESLRGYFEPRFEQNMNDRGFLDKMIFSFTASQCQDSDMFLAASEALYRLSPDAEAAYQLAVQYTAKGDYSSAIAYLQLAVQGEDLGDDTRAEWLYKLAVVSSANKEYCAAINHARKAIAIKRDFGKAYMALGDAIVANRYSLDDEFEQRAAFWVAADKYTQAISLDPSLETEARKKLDNYRSLYPDKEETFFRDLQKGASYRVAGCINESTTVR